MYSTTRETKAPQGKISSFFSWKLFKIAFKMRNLAHRWPQSGPFFQKLGHFCPIFEKGQDRPPPIIPLVTHLRSLKRRAILKIPIQLFRRTYTLSAGFKMKLLRKVIFQSEEKNPNFAVNFAAYQMNHFVQTSVLLILDIRIYNKT